MRRVGPLSLEGALLFLFVGVCLLGVTTCNARRDVAREERVAHLSANAHRASLAAIAARRSTDSLAALSIRQANIVKQQSARVTMLGRQLGAVLATNDSILSLPPDSVGEGVLRYQLAKTSEQVRLFRDSTETLITGVVIMLSAHEAERQAWLAEREQNAIQLAAKNRLIRELRESEQCRILFLPCPSRVQAVGIGAGIVLLLIL